MKIKKLLYLLLFAGSMAQADKITVSTAHSADKEEIIDILPEDTILTIKKKIATLWPDKWPAKNQRLFYYKNGKEDIRGITPIELKENNTELKEYVKAIGDADRLWIMFKENKSNV